MIHIPGLQNAILTEEDAMFNSVNEKIFSKNVKSVKSDVPVES